MPLIKILPAVGVRRPLIILIRVVLPLPLGPSSPMILPLGMVRFKLLTARVLPYTFVNPCITANASIYISPSILALPAGQPEHSGQWLLADSLLTVF